MLDFSNGTRKEDEAPLKHSYSDIGGHSTRETASGATTAVTAQSS